MECLRKIIQGKGLLVLRVQTKQDKMAHSAAKILGIISRCTSQKHSGKNTDNTGLSLAP